MDKVDVLDVVGRAFSAANAHYDDLATGGDAYSSGGPNAVARRDRYLKEHAAAQVALREAVSTLTACRDMLRESAKMHRLAKNYGHAETCEEHAADATAALSALAGASR